MPQESGPLVGAGDWLTTQYLDEPAGTLGRTLARSNIIAAALGTLTSGTVYVSRLLLPRGIPVTNVNILSNTTAEATGTHCWAGLAGRDLVVKGISADNTGAAFFAASTFQQFAFGQQYVTEYDGYYYALFCCAATTPPTLSGNTLPAGIASQAPIICATSDTGKTTPYAAGAAIGALTASTIHFYATVS